jgi:phosphoribosylformylglycinamidine cyclo-ligase
MAHVTGGGLIENLPRMFVDDSLAALVDLDSWQRPAVFGWLAQAGNVAEAEMLRTFNCGIGFVLCIAAADAADALAALNDAGETPVVIGKVVAADSAAPPGQLSITSAGARLT